LDREELKLEIHNIAHKYGTQNKSLSIIGKRKVSLVLGELLKLIESLETEVAQLKPRPRGRPRKIKTEDRDG